MSRKIRLLTVVIIVLIGVSMTACSNNLNGSSNESKPDNVNELENSNEIEIAMVTDRGDINDKSVNQGTWEGVVSYAEPHGITHQYFRPAEATVDAYVTAIEQAIENGAKVVVVPGFSHAVPIFTVQDRYPDTTFILLDEFPNDGDPENPTYKTENNTVGVKFAEHESGYLAGYAAVKDGYTKLGFMGGMAVPAVVRYGYGFVNGANDAAAEMGINVDIKYYYMGTFEATPEGQAMAAGWYNSGTEVIFACGGDAGSSIMRAAESSDAKVIGVDVDQSAESETIITSAMKNLGQTINVLLSAYYDGTFPGGENLTMGAKDNGVALPIETSKFNTFSQNDYDNLYSALENGSITVKTDTDADDPTGLGVTNVNLDYIIQ